ncbi:MAG: hypothetical protein ACOYMA_12420 [Bacteroidia bacterium]
MKKLVKILRLVLIILFISIGYGIYYLANGCYCDPLDKLCNSTLVERIEYSDSARHRIIVDRDSIKLIADILNLSILNRRHGKFFTNEYTDDVFRLEVFSKGGESIRLDVKRINYQYYYIDYQRNGDLFKQCVLGNNNLNAIIW